MSPITHLLFGWTLADRAGLAPRDRAIVAWAGLAPDMDGLPLFVDLARRFLGAPDASYYLRFHHMLTHGLPAAVVAACLAASLGVSRARAAVFAFLAFHIHLLCDLLGSRGVSRADIWPIEYLQPVSDRLTLGWSGQWPLNGWQNFGITAALIALAIVRALKTGDSPVGLFSAHANAVFVSVIRGWFGRRRAV